MSQAYRPFKFGHRDRREFIVENSEVALRVINDTSGNPIYLGRAIAGSAESEQKWQIRQITYDGNGGVVSVKWPQDLQGNASTDYEFAWSLSAVLTITGISQANPAVVTVSSTGSLMSGDSLIITGVNGMTEVNFDGTNIYTAANVTGTTFELMGIDSTAFGAYTSGGTVFYGNAINLTYS